MSNHDNFILSDRAHMRFEEKYQACRLVNLVMTHISAQIYLENASVVGRVISQKLIIKYVLLSI